MELNTFVRVYGSVVTCYIFEVMNSLSHSDYHSLSAAVGWLALGSPLAANAELEKITPALRSHPGVLVIRYQIYAKESNWDACLDIAQSIITQAYSHWRNFHQFNIQVPTNAAVMILKVPPNGSGQKSATAMNALVSLNSPSIEQIQLG